MASMLGPGHPATRPPGRRRTGLSTRTTNHSLRPSFATICSKPAMIRTVQELRKKRGFGGALPLNTYNL